MIETYQELLKTAKTIAVVGCSRDPSKDAHRVPVYLQAHGYRIIPVNPSAGAILGERCYPSLNELHEKVDIVDVFRPSNDVPTIVEQAVLMNQKPRAIWTQLGIVSEEGRKRAEANGIVFVEDKCIMTEHRRLHA